MELKKVHIENFRSIKRGEIFFDNRCRILVGKTGSGKSNLLKALSLLNEKTTNSIDDIRQNNPKEKPIENSFVSFYLDVSQKEIKDFYKLMKEKLSLEESEDDRSFQVNGIDISFWKICKELVRPCIYKVNLKDNTRGFLLQELKIKYKNIELKTTPEELGKEVKTELLRYLTESLPKTIYWKYSEEHFLPDRISITEFMKNPDTCPPLKNMFYYAGYSNISDAIQEANSRKKGIFNLLGNVSTLITEHLHNTWPEHEGINLELLPSGVDFIDINIKEENTWSYSQRSDGFKRFLSFLLEISVTLNTESNNPIILLLDEPGQGLHPSAEKDLLRELLNLAKTNYIVYSTHSPSMIDKDRVRRHIVLKKNNEISMLNQVEESQITDEEVIFQAMGYSIFDSLNKRNLLFEGWRDKKLFEIAIDYAPQKISYFKRDLQRLGKCHAQGVKDISNITPLLELAHRKCIIISDCDEPAKRHQKIFQDEKSYGIWKRYDEFITSLIFTSEDFIKPEFIKLITDHFSKKYPEKLKPLSLEELSNSPNGYITTFSNWLRAAGFNDAEIKESLNLIKEEIFNKLKGENIKDDYFDFILSLIKLLRTI